MLKETYVDMEIALPREREGPEFSKVTKRLQDANGITIGSKHDNHMLDIRVYDVGYLYGHKASLSANTITENIFPQVDKEGNIFVLFDDKIDHLVDGTENIPQGVFNYCTAAVTNVEYFLEKRGLMLPPKCINLCAVFIVHRCM